MSWTYKLLTEIESLICHLCREEIGTEAAGLIQVDGGPNGNCTTGLYHDKCWEKLKEDKLKMEENNAKSNL